MTWMLLATLSCLGKCWATTMAHLAKPLAGGGGVRSCKNWGLAQHELQVLCKGIRAVCCAGPEGDDCKLVKRICRATDLTWEVWLDGDELAQVEWVRSLCQVAKHKTKERDRIAHNVLRVTVASKVAEIQRMGDHSSVEYHAQVKQAMWGDWGKALKVVMYEEDGALCMAVDPAKVKDVMHKVWAKQFKESVHMHCAGAQAPVHLNKWDAYITPLMQDASDAVGALVTAEELSTAVRKLKKHMVPGPTGKMPEMLAWLSDDNWTRAVNAVLEMGLTLDVWKHVLLHMIYKAGNLSVPLNYCPIALMPVLYKLVSKIITNQLYSTVKQGGLLSVAQGGFCKQRSTLSHVHALHGCFEDAKK